MGGIPLKSVGLLAGEKLHVCKSLQDSGLCFYRVFSPSRKSCVADLGQQADNQHFHLAIGTNQNVRAKHPQMVACLSIQIWIAWFERLSA